MRFTRSTLAAAISVSSCIPVTAFAAESFMLEEVVVTAQKRSESVQDIPLAVTALSADILDERGIGDIASLVSSVPGMHFGQAGSDTLYRAALAT